MLVAVLLVILAIATWVLVLASGVHATIAGVLLGLAMAQGPALRVRHAIEPWVNAVVLPIFAFMAALVPIPQVAASDLSPAFWGILLALPIGKIIGIAGAGWLAQRFGAGGGDQKLAFGDLLAAGALGGIGFTVSLLLANLAFDDAPFVRDQAILGVLAGSLIALVLAGAARLVARPPPPRNHDIDRHDRRGGARMNVPVPHAEDPLRAAADTMHEVRDRCVWTQQIDHRALVPYLVEESAELIDAVETGSRAELREELGDLLWQVLFHAEIASRDPDEPFDIDDVARGLTDKMVRRHPHVFAGEVAETPEQVLVLWNAAKAAEKHERTSVLDGVSERMPSLALAQKLIGKAARSASTSSPGTVLSNPRRSSATRCSNWSRPRVATGGMPNARSASASAHCRPRFVKANPG